MDNHLSITEQYYEAAKSFHWATKRHFELWFTGLAPRRHRRTEMALRRLTKNGRLTAVRYGRQLIYSVPRKAQAPYGLSMARHGLSVTECLVRFYRSDTSGVVIPERSFRSMGCVPEWGLFYPTGTMLLLEFCTRDNFMFSGVMKAKLTAYESHLENISQHFGCKAVLVFVIDTQRELVEHFASHANCNHYFTDYQTFCKVPMGQALYEPIYLWRDGSNYPLRDHVQLEND